MKFLKYILILLVILLVAAFVAMKFMSEPLPEGQAGAAADAWAMEIQNTLNKPAFDTIPYLRWEFFRAGQKYFWDKTQNAAVIEWGDNKVVMDLDNQKAHVTSKGVVQSGEVAEKLKQKAWSHWCNDSFWMIAPFKMMDPGTSREIVETEEGKKALMVRYDSGGVTPGDSYLWEIGADNIPTGWRMWTSILPVKGVHTPWTGWETHGGALFSLEHELMGKTMRMSDVKAGQSWNEFGYDEDPFAVLKTILG